MKRYIKSAISKLSYEPLDAQLDLVGDPNLDSDLLDDLADSADWEVQLAVSTHPNTSAKTLDKLASATADKAVRINIAQHPHTSVETLKKLSQDNDSPILYGVLNNPNCTQEIKTMLWDNGDDWIRRNIIRFATDPDFLDSLIADATSDQLFEICKNSNTSPQTLHTLLVMDIQDKFVRRAIASHWATTAQDLEVLANDNDWGVLNNLIENTHTPTSALATIANTSVYPQIAKHAQQVLEQRGIE